MAGFPSTVSQFWGEEISESKPAEYAPDPEGDLTLQITGISFADGNANKGETYIVSMSADDSPPYTIAILRPGKTDQVQVDVLLGSGNEKVEFFVKGGKAKIHLTGFEILEDNGDDDFDEENQLGGLDEDDDDDDDDDDDLAEEDDEPPFKLIYCDVCGLPPEYCEYGDNYEKCVPWIKENCPHLLKECISVDTKKKNKRGGGVLKKKELSEDKIRLIVYTETRSRKKTVTVVDGLETFGIKLKDAAKIFGRKFASSSSVKDKDTGGSEVVIQGDVIFDLPDLLQSEFKIPQSKLFTKEGGKIVPLR
mmetsp:Transcript_7153/g.9083  ORF Transcript_7153/g.9083 Transcript_7153/m.9083 type:complete len:307 (-) Transcript_7153:231-1151(-)